MKTSSSILGALLFGVATATADDMVLATNAPSGMDLGWVVEVDGRIANPGALTDAWMEGERGVIIQFLEAPNPLAPINPLTPPPPRVLEATLSRDTVTGRVMGLRLLSFEF